MSLTSDLITYIKANASSFNTVEHAWTMQPFENTTTNIPAALVFPGEEKSNASNTTCVIQETNREVCIFVIASAEELEAAKDELSAAVLGWQYNSNYTPLEHSKGEPQEIKGSYVWYLESYVTTYQRRAS